MPDLPDPAAATLDAAELAELAEFGDERVVEVGDVLYPPAPTTYDLFVVLEGEVEIVRHDTDGDVVVAPTARVASSASSAC